MNVVSFVYDKIGLYNLGQANQLLIFAGYFFSGPFAQIILAYFDELKYGMFVGLLIYGSTVFVASGTYACWWMEGNSGLCSLGFLRLTNYFTSFMRGFYGAVFVWSGQYKYVDNIARQEEKKELFGLFSHRRPFSDAPR